MPPFKILDGTSPSLEAFLLLRIKISRLFLSDETELSK